MVVLLLGRACEFFLSLQLHCACGQRSSHIDLHLVSVSIRTLLVRISGQKLSVHTFLFSWVWCIGDTCATAVVPFVSARNMENKRSDNNSICFPKRYFGAVNTYSLLTAAWQYCGFSFNSYIYTTNKQFNIWECGAFNSATSPSHKPLAVISVS